MKQTFTLIAALIMMTLSSCTHNNGDIGNLFGTWRITSIEIDGTTSEEYEGRSFIAFQNNVVGLYTREKENPNAASWWTYAKYYYSKEEYDGATANLLILDFSGIKYSIPDQFPFDKAPNKILIRSQSSNNMIWEMRRDGSAYIITLKKLK